MEIAIEEISNRVQIVLVVGNISLAIPIYNQDKIQNFAPGNRREGEGGPVCRSFLPGQLPVLPFICSQAASISQVVQGLGVLYTWAHFQAPAGKAAPSIL